MFKPMGGPTLLIPCLSQQQVSGISRSLDYERSCKLQRLATSSHLQVDEEILRGIPLKERASWLWVKTNGIPF